MNGDDLLRIHTISDVRRQCANGEAARIREAARLSQVEMAAVVGVSPAAISRWEAGVRMPRGDAALRYARLLSSLGRVMT